MSSDRYAPEARARANCKTSAAALPSDRSCKVRANLIWSGMVSRMLTKFNAYLRLRTKSLALMADCNSNRPVACWIEKPLGRNGSAVMIADSKFPF